MSAKRERILMSHGPPWGFRIGGGKGTGRALTITRVNERGRDHGLQEDDRILVVNGQACGHMSQADAQRVVKNSSSLELVIERTQEPPFSNGGFNHTNGTKDHDAFSELSEKLLDSQVDLTEDPAMCRSSWSSDSTSTGSTTIHVAAINLQKRSMASDVWSPSTVKKRALRLNIHPETPKAPSSEQLPAALATPKSSATGDPQEDNSPIWQPFGAPYDGSPQFRRVKLDVKVNSTKSFTQETTTEVPDPQTAAAPQPEAFESSPRSESEQASIVPLATVPNSTPTTFTKTGWSSHLPPSQSPTITLLQKAREGQLPKGAIYMDDRINDSSSPLPKNAVLIDQKVTVEGDKVHTDSYYAVPTVSTDSSTVTIKAPSKYDGIGPTEYGIPVGLRTGVKEEYASDWYKTMYKSLHRNKPEHSGKTVHMGGYMSEPEFDRKDTYASKYLTADYRRRPEKSVSYASDTSIRNSKMENIVEKKSPRSPRSPNEPQVVHSDSQQNFYRNEPRSIAEYEPGRSSLAEQEFQKFWSDFWDSMEDLHEHLGGSPRSPQQSLNKRWPNVLLSDGYESDSTLIRKTGRDLTVKPEQQKEWYKEIQKGGEIPMIGLRKSAPEKPKAVESYQEHQDICHGLSSWKNTNHRNMYRYTYKAMPITNSPPRNPPTIANELLPLPPVRHSSKHALKVKMLESEFDCAASATGSSRPNKERYAHCDWIKARSSGNPFALNYPFIKVISVDPIPPDQHRYSEMCGRNCNNRDAEVDSADPCHLKACSDFRGAPSMPSFGDRCVPWAECYSVEGENMSIKNFGTEIAVDNDPEFLWCKMEENDRQRNHFYGNSVTDSVSESSSGTRNFDDQNTSLKLRSPLANPSTYAPGSSDSKFIDKINIQVNDMGTKETHGLNYNQDLKLNGSFNVKEIANILKQSPRTPRMFNENVDASIESVSLGNFALLQNFWNNRYEQFPGLALNQNCNSIFNTEIVAPSCDLIINEEDNSPISNKASTLKSTVEPKNTRIESNYVDQNKIVNTASLTFQDNACLNDIKADVSNAISCNSNVGNNYQTLNEASDEVNTLMKILRIDPSLVRVVTDSTFVKPQIVYSKQNSASKQYCTPNLKPLKLCLAECNFNIVNGTGISTVMAIDFEKRCQLFLESQIKEVQSEKQLTKRSTLNDQFDNSKHNFTNCPKTRNNFNNGILSKQSKDIFCPKTYPEKSKQVSNRHILNKEMRSFYHNYITSMLNTSYRTKNFIRSKNVFSCSRFENDFRSQCSIFEAKKFEISAVNTCRTPRWNKESERSLRGRNSSVEDLRQVFLSAASRKRETSSFRMSFRYQKMWYNVNVSSLVEKYNKMQFLRVNHSVELPCSGYSPSRNLSKNVSLSKSENNIIRDTETSNDIESDLMLCTSSRVFYGLCQSDSSCSNSEIHFKQEWEIQVNQSKFISPTEHCWRNGLKSKCRSAFDVRSKVEYFESICKETEVQKRTAGTLNDHFNNRNMSRNFSYHDLSIPDNKSNSKTTLNVWSSTYVPERAVSYTDLRHVSEAYGTSDKPSSSDSLSTIPGSYGSHRLAKTGIVEKVKKRLENSTRTFFAHQVGYEKSKSLSLPRNIGSACSSEEFLSDDQKVLGSLARHPSKVSFGSVQSLREKFQCLNFTQRPSPVYASREDKIGEHFKSESSLGFSSTSDSSAVRQVSSLDICTGRRPHPSNCKRFPPTSSHPGFIKRNIRALMAKFEKSRPLQKLIAKFEPHLNGSPTTIPKYSVHSKCHCLVHSKRMYSSTHNDSNYYTLPPLGRHSPEKAPTRWKCNPTSRLHPLQVEPSRKKSDSPHQYQETEVNIHFKSPIRNLEKEFIEEEELRKRQEDAMRKFYEEERRKKHLQEMAEIEMRRHSDFFTPSQKSPIALNRYDNPFDIHRYRSSPLARTIARALYPFTAQSTRELSLNKGDIIYIIKQVDNNWFEGEHHGLIGIFPTSYVEIIPDEKANLQPRKATEGHAIVKYNFRAQTKNELSLFKRENVILTRRIDRNWYEGRLGAKKGLFPASYVNVLQEPGEFTHVVKALSPKPPTSPVFGPIINGSAPRRNEGPTFNTGLRPSQNKLQTPLEKLEDRYSLTQSLHIDTYNEPIPYRSLYTYKPQNDDELELQDGDTVYVMEKCDDGWYVGTSLRTGQFGTFPGNYVERI